MKKSSILFLLISVFFFISCGEEPVLFSIQDDMALGLQVKEEIESNPDVYPILSESAYPEAYSYIKNH